MKCDSRGDKGGGQEGGAGNLSCLVPPVTLAEAGYLRDALRDEGIRAVVMESGGKSDTNRAIHSVMVPTAELHKALELRCRLLPEDRRELDRELLAPMQEVPASAKAAVAGLLGMLAGLRIGRGSPRFTALYCLGLGVVAFLGVFLSIKYVPCDAERLEDGDTPGSRWEDGT